MSFSLLSCFNIPEWTNSVELPPRSNIPEALSKLEVKLRFTVTGEDPYSVFVSDETDADFLTQLIHFFPPETAVYKCPLPLIRERLHIISIGQENTENNSVSEYITALFETAINKNATDIHIEEGEDSKRVRFRINGMLVDADDFKDYEAGIRVKLKLLAGMNISESRRPQEGGIKYNNAHNKRYYFRVSVSPGIYHEKIAIRILSEESVTQTLAELNFSPKIYNELKTFVKKQAGWMIICGPTGSGKTTTLYGILNELNQKNLSIETIEDPVEYRMDNIHQTQIDPAIGINFSDSLKHALRLDPDVILVGEIRDDETAMMALRAAQTGHVVLSSLHSNDPLEAINRLKLLNLNPNDIFNTVGIIMSQRLLTLNCDCSGDKSCPKCTGSGVLGRIPRNEYLKIDPQKIPYDDFLLMQQTRKIPENIRPFYYKDENFR